LEVNVFRGFSLVAADTVDEIHFFRPHLVTSILSTDGYSTLASTPTFEFNTTRG